MRALIFSLSLVVTLPLFGAVVGPLQPADENTVRVLVPAFGGGESGRAAATLINLQIWKTLRIAQGSDTPLRGEVAWDGPLRELTFEAAEARAREMRALAVVWGEVLEAGDGVIVQAHLALPKLPADHTRAFQQWNVQLRYDRDTTETVGLELLRRRYDFEPIAFPKALLANYRNLKELPLYETATSDKIVGRIGDENFIAISSEGDAVRVLTSSHISGWIRPPNLTELQNEIATFTSALVRLFRFDWKGANRLFTSVLTRSALPQTVKIDAYAYRALARYNAKLPGWDQDLSKAIEVNPYVRSSAATQLVLVAAEANRAETAGDRAQSVSYRKRVKDLMKTHGALFSEKDPLFAKLKVFAARPID